MEYTCYRTLQKTVKRPRICLSPNQGIPRQLLLRTTQYSTIQHLIGSKALVTGLLPVSGTLRRDRKAVFDQLQSAIFGGFAALFDPGVHRVARPLQPGRIGETRG